MKIIPRKLRKLGTTLVETLPPIGIAGFLATSILPALSKAKAKANRAKCANNLKQIGSAMNGFATSNEDFPWALTQRDGTANYKDQVPGQQDADWQSAHHIEQMWGTPDIRSSIRTAKILLSPCDPGSKQANQNEVAKELNGNSVGIAGDNEVTAAAISYGIHKGGSTSDGGTILSITKNALATSNQNEGNLKPVEVDGSNPTNNDLHIAQIRQNVSEKNNLYGYNCVASTRVQSAYDGWLNVAHGKKHYFVGPDVDRGLTYRQNNNKRSVHRCKVMAGLNENQGQFGMADGSASWINDVELVDAIRVHSSRKTNHIYPIEAVTWGMSNMAN